MSWYVIVVELPTLQVRHFLELLGARSCTAGFWLLRAAECSDNIALQFGLAPDRLFWSAERTNGVPDKPKKICYFSHTK